jgi:hypothetical protein
MLLLAYKRCSARLYLQLFLGGFMSYLHCLCLFAYTGSVVQQHIVLCFCFAEDSFYANSEHKDT